MIEGSHGGRRPRKNPSRGMPTRVIELTAGTRECVRRVLVAMMIADEDIDADEVATVRRIYAEMTGETLSIAQLREEVTAACRAGLTVQTCLANLADDLDLPTRQRLLEAAFAVASADGFVLEEEEVLLGQVATALGLDDAQTRATLNRSLG